MKITNKFGIPQFLFDRLSRDYYGGKRGPDRFSATEILNPPMYVWLNRRHHDEIVVDVLGILYSIQGSLMHLLMDQIDDNALTEERLSHKYNGVVLSGGFDRFDESLWDYKYTSVWSHIKKTNFPKWEVQLNIYNYLLRQAGFDPVDLNIIEMFRDWSYAKYKINVYGDLLPIEIVKMEKYPDNITEDLIHNRIDYLLKFRYVPDEELPECPMEDRWQDPDKFAVMKEGGKRASITGYDRKELEEWIAKQKDPSLYNIELRTFEPRRCGEKIITRNGAVADIGYCRVKQWCPWWQSHKHEFGESSED